MKNFLIVEFYYFDIFIRSHINWSKEIYYVKIFIFVYFFIFYSFYEL